MERKANIGKAVELVVAGLGGVDVLELVHALEDAAVLEGQHGEDWGDDERMEERSEGERKEGEGRREGGMKDGWTGFDVLLVDGARAGNGGGVLADEEDVLGLRVLVHELHVFWKRIEKLWREKQKGGKQVIEMEGRKGREADGRKGGGAGEGRKERRGGKKEVNGE